MALLGKGANKSVRTNNYLGGISRSKTRRHFKWRSTFSAGSLIPLFCDEFIPAETKSVNLGELIRSITPLGPTMDNAFFDIFCFFVPRRLVWDHWEEFIAGYNKEAWAQDVVYEVPKIKFKKDTINGTITANTYIGSFFDYMPGAVDVVGLARYMKNARDEGTTQAEIDAYLKFNYIDACYPRSYVKIWNDWFRDENLQDELELYTGDSDEYAQEFSFDLLASLPKAAKYHNRFTTALPAPLKGPDVLIPTSTDFAFLNTHENNEHEYFDGYINLIGEDNESPSGFLAVNNGGVFSDSNVVQTGDLIVGSNLGINIKNVMGTIRQLRLATQTELLLARDARGGTRYIESLLSHFGVHNGDARLQRSEYLGSRQIPLSVTQVTNTSQADDNALGNVGGQSVTKDAAHYFTYSATEHGILWIVGVVRTNLSYSSGVRKIYQRWTRFDHIWPEFKHVGDVPLYKKELDTFYALTDSGNWGSGEEIDKEVFGYTPYGSECREGYNFNVGLFRNHANGSLAYLTYQEDYSDTNPVLSDMYIEQSSEVVSNTLIDQEGPQFYALFDLVMDDTLPLDPTSDPGLMDHF